MFDIFLSDTVFVLFVLLETFIDIDTVEILSFFGFVDGVCGGIFWKALFLYPVGNFDFILHSFFFWFILEY